LCGRLENDVPERIAEEVKHKTSKGTPSEVAAHTRSTGLTRVHNDDMSVHWVLVRTSISGKVLLEALSESHEGELGRCVGGVWVESLSSFLLSDLCFLDASDWEGAADVGTAGCHDDTDVAVWRLGADGRRQDAEEVEVGEVVQAPVDLDVVICGLNLSTLGGHCVGAEDDHVETARRSIVDPFCGELTDRVEGAEVDVGGGDEFVVCAIAQFFNVRDEEEVVQGVLGEEDELSASCR